MLDNYLDTFNKTAMNNTKILLIIFIIPPFFIYAISLRSIIKSNKKMIVMLNYFKILIL